MKKITALLLCFLLLCTCSVTAFAAEPEAEETNTVISVTVPDSHKITVTADSARVFYEGVSGEEFTVERLSEPRLLIRAESGKVIKSVMLNDVDVTAFLHGGYLDLTPVYEDKEITVTTEDEPVAPKETYTVKGKVTLNGQPLSEVDLELRSTLKTTKTDSSGKFVFTDVEPGQHSLTALRNGKVIGYLSFELKKDNKADVALLEDGTYTVSIDQNGAGVELHLVLNEEAGTLAPTEIGTIEKADPNSPQTGDNTNLSWWWLLAVLSATCIVALETYCRKKLVN
ncbi:MAG: carboxypeptidase regulatory-like domain-containing protein [Oscillospiraceae bacterium]|nr:carboxypeptidase regulatory-like domain-containing protein [Oscillospiraceae bacterium]